MSATRRVLVGAVLGASLAAIIRMPAGTTEAAFTDSERITITVTTAGWVQDGSPVPTPAPAATSPDEPTAADAPPDPGSRS